MSHPESQYLNLLRHLVTNGEMRTGRNGVVYSDFGHRLEFNIAKDGFPLLTTKKMHMRGIAEELFWFLRGSTDNRELQEKGVHIWDGNSTRSYLDSVGLVDTPENHIGAGYGFQLRASSGNYPSREGGVDQLRYVIKELIENPTGRRALMVYWNPKQLSQMALPPCHYSYQFYLTSDRKLHCQMIMRSCDTAIGLPYNIASTALLVTIIAWAIGDGAVPGKIVICTGDTHVYDVHLEGVQEQLSREPKNFCKVSIGKDLDLDLDLNIDKRLAAIERLVFEDIVVENYDCHGLIKMQMVA